MVVLVTGGAGFIGSHFVRYALAQGAAVLNVDKLCRQGNIDNAASLHDHPHYTFVHADIADEYLLGKVLRQHRVRAIVNFAAETHVDRSIDKPSVFWQSNILASCHLLEAVRDFWLSLPADERHELRFLQISTDEVYGELGADVEPLKEGSPYRASSPYAASKAAIDQFVYAYHKTYRLPVLLLHAVNHYGPRQLPEKLIPFFIAQALQGHDLPLYGDGKQLRDWLFVEDGVRGIWQVLRHGRVGECYHLGAQAPLSNLAVVQQLCQALDRQYPRRDGRSYGEQVRHVQDRAGHDKRYALNCDKLRQQLGWSPQFKFAQGLRATLAWYLQHQDWCYKAMEAR